MTPHALARLRFDCFMQAQQFSRPAPVPSDVAGKIGFHPREGIGLDEALEIAGKIEAFCMRDLGERERFDLAALAELRKSGEAGY